MYTAHWPRLHPPISKVKTLDGVADDWPIDYDALTPFFEENDPYDGRIGPVRRSAFAADQAADAATAARTFRPLIGKARTSSAGTGGHRTPRLRPWTKAASRRCINLGHCTSARAQGRKGFDRHHLLAARDPCGVELKDSLRGVREILTNEHGMAFASSITTRMASSSSSRLRSSSSLYRRWHAAVVAQLGFRPFQMASPIRPDWSART